MPWIALAAGAVTAGSSYFANRSANRRAQQQRAYEQQAAQNDPREALRRAMTTDLFFRHPEWEQRFPGLREQLMAQRTIPPYQRTGSVWDSIGRGVVTAGQTYAAREKQKQEGTPTNNVSDIVGGTTQCPPGQIYYGPGVGCSQPRTNGAL